MSIPLTEVVYPLDQTGLSVSNKIIKERHELTSTTWSGFNLIIPKAAPFFDDSITHLVHYPSGDILEKGRDWITGWMFQSATAELGQFLSGCIYIFDTALAGHIEIPSYQCLGGEWQLDTQVLEAILADKLLNPQRFYWEYVANTPNIFRPLDHDQDIDEFSELGSLLDELRGISNAIRLASESGALGEHESKKNPHNMGPGDLTTPLDRLLNYRIATLLEMSDPNNLPSTRYVSPPGVKRLIEVTALAALQTFAARRDNPNNVTAEQAGTLDTDQIHALIQNYLSGGTGGEGGIDASTLQGRNFAQVVQEAITSLNPILAENLESVMAAVNQELDKFVETNEVENLIIAYLARATTRIDADTLEGKDLDGVVAEAMLAVNPVLLQQYNRIVEDVALTLSGFVANDTARFAGLNNVEWDQRIIELAGAVSGVVWLPSVVELLEPENPPDDWVKPDFLVSEPTTTLVAAFAEESNPRWADTGHVSVYMAGVGYHITIYPLTKKIEAWSDGPIQPGVSFFVDEAGEADLLRLWMVAPADRTAATVLSKNSQNTTLYDGMTVFGNSTVTKPWINNPVTVNMKVPASMANINTLQTNIAAVITAQAALGQRVTTAEQEITNVKERVSATEQEIEDLKDDPGSDLVLVSGTSTINANTALTFNLQTLLTASGHTGYDLGRAMVYVRIKNTDASSPNHNSWINAEAICSYGLRANLTTAFVHNHSDAQLDAFIRVSVPKT